MCFFCDVLDRFYLMVQNRNISDKEKYIFEVMIFNDKVLK